MVPDDFRGEHFSNATDRLAKYSKFFRVRASYPSEAMARKWSPVFAKHFETLKTLTNLDVRFANTEEHVEAGFVFNNKATLLSHVFSEPFDGPCQRIALATSGVAAKTNSSDVTLTGIRTEHLGGIAIESCILISLVRSLKLHRQNNYFSQSIWNFRAQAADPNNPGQLDYTPLDKMIIKAHYDPRLKVGMKRKEALPIFRQIITELWPEFMGRPAR